MSPETRYKIEELEQLTGLSRRLIYDYISRELVPPALGSGKGAYYLAGHYDRLRLISLLRTMGFRLERIEEALQSWSAEEISRIVEFAEGRDMESLDALNDWLAPPARAEMGLADTWGAAAEFAEAVDNLAEPGEDFEEAAADFAESIAEQRGSEDHPRAEDALSSLLFAPSAVTESPREARRFSSADALERVRKSAASLMGTTARQATQDKMAAEEDAIHDDQMSLVSHMMVRPDEPSPAETWHRVQLTPDIEINYRTDIDPEQRGRIGELIARAKELFHK